MTRRRPERPPQPGPHGQPLRRGAIVDCPPGDPYAPQPPANIGGIDPHDPHRGAHEIGDGIEAFRVVGGRPLWRSLTEEIDGTQGDERLSGAQLLASVYIPEGRVGYIKDVRAQPYFLEQIGRWSEDEGFEPQPPDRFDLTFADPFAGAWQTPIGWEQRAAGSGPQTGANIVEWEFGLVLIAGQIPANRIAAGLPPDFALPDVPVPQAVYDGHPFDPLGAEWVRSRMQHGGLVRTASAQLMVPPRTTALLVARWTQQPGVFRTHCCEKRIVRTVTVPSSGSEETTPIPPFAETVLVNAVVDDASSFPRIAVNQENNAGGVLRHDRVRADFDDWRAPLEIVPGATQITTDVVAESSPVQVTFFSSRVPGLALGPSAGLMQGYTLPTNAASAKDAARYGWGG